jgi:5-methylcytosine-specific restriction endonuclease McrA
MKLKDYLVGKYRSSGTMALSDDEANALSIPIPLERGWTTVYEGQDVTLEQAKKLMALMQRGLQNFSSPRKKTNCQWAIETIRRYFGRDADCEPAPRQDREVRIKRKEKRRAKREARKAERRRKFWASRACGATPEDGLKMHVDHIKPRKHYPHLALEHSNLQVLCEVCNHGKGNWDQTDWRKERPAANEPLPDGEQQHIRSIVEGQ